MNAFFYNVGDAFYGVRCRRGKRLILLIKYFTLSFELLCCSQVQKLKSSGKKTLNATKIKEMTAMTMKSE